MKKLTVGILAHVDAGKTTLSEALLYRSGRIKRLGRVDHQDAFLDTDALERERGITIFSKQAVFPLGELEATLLDTPGHVDFSSEMERTLQVLDCAVLVLSGADGVQSHTRTLWKLLERYGVPTFLFVNKMDLPGADRAGLRAGLERLSGGCVDFGAADSEREEALALCGEEAMDRYLETGAVGEALTRDLIRRRQVFPCLFGSALRLDGVDALLRCLERYAPVPDYGPDFAARVFKITRDPQGVRLAHLKITGGSLRVKDQLAGETGGEAWTGKADQIRIYSGAKFQTVDEAPAGTVCAVTGLARAWAGQGLGAEAASRPPELEPVLTYRLLLPEGCDPFAVLPKLRQLEEEDPQLHMLWDERLRQIHLQLMGEVQLEILKRLIAQRFGLEVEFGPGGIVYRETIAAPVEGVGHFEPLRHYAEVHLLLEPGARGSGLRFASACPEEVLSPTWQRLVLTHLAERVHLGVLTGSPITDMKITLVSGRGHEKHTEGGDFRQAAYRAVRQGLMGAESILLEPWYDFTLELPASAAGRAMTDLQRMAAVLEAPEQLGETTVLTGSAPVAALRGYAGEVAAYTRGLGHLSCALRGYEPCPDQAAVAEASGYDPERDLEHTPDSVFCAHGAGYTVKWNEVPAHMHLPSILDARPVEEAPPPPRRADPGVGYDQDKELQAIFERTYGPVKPRAFRPPPPPRAEALPERRSVPDKPVGPEYLLVDGYNIIHAWDDLAALAAEDLAAARGRLMDLLSNYQGYRKCVLILVFDAYKVPRSTGEVGRYHNISVVYTKEAETADAYIEKATYALSREHKRVRVATSDGLEQLIILGHGALRVPAGAFRQEVEAVLGEIGAILERNNVHQRAHPIRAAFERAKGDS